MFIAGTDWNKNQSLLNMNESFFPMGQKPDRQASFKICVSDQSRRESLLLTVGGVPSNGQTGCVEHYQNKADLSLK